MKRYIKQILIAFFAVVLTSAFAPQAASDNLSAVINGNNADKEMTMSKLQNVIRGRTTRWSDNSVVKLAFLNPDTRTANLTASKLFFSGSNGAKMQQYFMKLVFQGKITAPKFFATEAELINYVKSTDGAIGIITSDKTGSSPLMKVDGKDSF